jgi:hypothetical protein
MDVWDPIGVKDEPNACNEYDTYIGGFFDLLVDNAPDSSIKNYMNQCVARMGMDSSRHTDQAVIDALHEIALSESAS